MSGDDTTEHRRDDDRDDATRHHHHRDGGRQSRSAIETGWLVRTLFGIIGLLILAWSGFVFEVAYASSQKNIEQDGQIKAIVDRMGGIEANQNKQDLKTDKLDAKMDRVLERLPK